MINVVSRIKKKRKKIWHPLFLPSKRFTLPLPPFSLKKTFRFPLKSFFTCFRSRLNHLRKGGIPGTKEEFRVMYEDRAIDNGKVCLQTV